MADSGLQPAQALAEASPARFPNESAEYRAARTELLTAEIELRRQIEAVAAMRRALPPGGIVPDTYCFIDENGAERRLADLFGEHDTLIAYAWMFGPERQRPCPMCTNFLGGLAANAADLQQRVAIAAIARSPVERQIAFKIERGWSDLPVYQAIGDDYLRVYGGLTPDGDEVPALNIFERTADGIRLFWAAEMGGETADPGQDPRGAPDLSILWTLLDCTRGGRGADWYPSLSYPG